MNFLFHLLTGIILGLLAGELLGDHRWVIPCLLGAILPDLIDKPLDLVMGAGNGSFYGHTLLAVLILGIAGLLLLKLRKDPALAALAAGILSHQVLDIMWREPKSWFYPAYGEFSQPTYSYDLGSMLVQELNDPLEILLFIGLGAGAGLVLVRHRIAAGLAPHTGGVRILLAAGMAGFLLLAGILVALSRAGHAVPPLAWSRAEHFLFGGAVAAMAAVLLWQWYRKLPAPDTGE